MADVIADGISGLSLLIAAGALLKSFAVDRRDREAIIIVTSVWDHVGDRHLIVFRSSGKPESVDTHPKPGRADDHWVIAGTPTVEDGLTLKQDDNSEKTDPDLENYRSHRRMLRFENGGRAAATDIVLRCLLAGTFLTKDLKAMTEDRTFETTIPLDGLAVGSSRLVEIRSLLGLPVRLKFLSVTCGKKGDQPARLSSASFSFRPRS